MSYTPSKIKRYYIGNKGDFLTIAAAVVWLGTGSNMTTPCELFLDSGTFNIADTISINLPYHLNIRGFDLDSTVLSAATGLTNKPMFSTTSIVFFERLKSDASTLASYGTLSTENFCDIIGTNYHEFTSIHVKGFYNGIEMTDNASYDITHSILENIVNIACDANSTGANSIYVQANQFINCQTCVGLTKSSAGMFEILQNTFTNSGAGQVCIIYNPPAYTYTNHPASCGNIWNGIGAFVTGADYTRTDGRDANISVLGNIGREDKKAHFKVNVISNASTTTVTTALAYYKAVFTNGTVYTVKFTLANNRYTYQPSLTGDLVVWISANVSVNGTNRNVGISLRKNSVATDISPMVVRCAASGEMYNIASVSYLPGFVAGDYFEIFVTSSTDGDLVTLTDLTLFVQTQ